MVTYYDQLVTIRLGDKYTCQNPPHCLRENVGKDKGARDQSGLALNILHEYGYVVYVLLLPVSMFSLRSTSHFRAHRRTP